MKKLFLSLSLVLISLFVVSCGESANSSTEPKKDDDKKRETMASNLVSKLTIKDFFQDKLSMEAIFNFVYDKSERIEEINIDHYALDGQSGATSFTKTKRDVEFEYSPSRIAGKQIDINEKGVKTTERIINTILDENNKARSSEVVNKVFGELASDTKATYGYKYDKNKEIEEVLLNLPFEGESIITKYEVSWKDANPVYISSGNKIYNYIYGTVLNNSNIDLNVYAAILSSRVIDFTKHPNMINLDLIKSKNLAESFSMASEDIVYTNKFDLDKDNRVVKITTYSKKGEQPKSKIRTIEVAYK